METIYFSEMNSEQLRDSIVHHREMRDMPDTTELGAMLCQKAIDECERLLRDTDALPR